MIHISCLPSTFHIRHFENNLHDAPLLLLRSTESGRGPMPSRWCRCIHRKEGEVTFRPQLQLRRVDPDVNGEMCAVLTAAILPPLQDAITGCWGILSSRMRHSGQTGRRRRDRQQRRSSVRNELLGKALLPDEANWRFPVTS
ncbi:AGAP010291-PA [Anopheles gambiae str. PEST]|uniref:AGAP010291-PA n=1 Tax=Anopheles gambiae TaxID=7165 RepID=A0NG55_ANOGA|nr:AGAP010291-PA [Anopheles gambiae str. PEST]